MHILTVIGARPQFIKAAVVSRVIRETDCVQESILHTGQHYDANMSDVFFEELDIPKPSIHLGVGSGTHGEQTARMLTGIEQALMEHRPDWLLVYGDTNSTLAGALAAAKLHVPVAHVEAGLRSFNRAMPEEINRIVTDHVASRLFCPTDTAVAHLQNEGITEGVHQVGDVMYDAALFYADRSADSPILNHLKLSPGAYALATVHRAENTDDPVRLGAIMGGLSRLSQRIPVVLPLHPRTRQVLDRQGSEIPAGIRTIEPVSYLDMVCLERNASLILTDSGGVQKEAYFHAVPCVTLRNETEWVELIDSGWNILAGADSERITAAAEAALTGPPEQHPPLYGEGHAGRDIVAALHTNRR